MPRMLGPFRFLLIAVAGWMNQRQVRIIEYLREVNRVLHEHLGDERLQFDARKGNAISRKRHSSVTESVASVSV